MKYCMVLLIAFQFVLFLGCNGTIAETEESKPVIEISAVTGAEELQISVESLPSPNVPKPPAHGLKPKPPEKTAVPSPSVSFTPSQVVSSNTGALEIQTVLNLGIMVHLEGWDDAGNEDKFRKHAELLRRYADLFEKYGARLTLESKEMTEGSIRWDDNVLLEMEERGHGIGVHADVGGNASSSEREMFVKLSDMKSRLQSLGVEVRHASGICSRCDWVTAAGQAGFEFVTGTVAFALASLPPQIQPISIPPSASPSEFHEAYPFTMEDRLFSWRAQDGSNWIFDNPEGKVVIIPSGGGIAYAFEESRGETGLAGDQQFTAEDIAAFENQLQIMLDYISSNKSTQPYTWYLSWSFGKALDESLMEQWLKMVEKYVDAGKVRWQTIPEMYDDYIQWEIDSGRRN